MYILFRYPNLHTDKKENKIFFIYHDIQKGSIAKSYKTNDFFIYG
jgi:hypothetical protein